MRHLNSYSKLGRRSDHRRALLRNLATSFFVHGSIKTTLPKAKALRPIVEKLITLGKRGDLHARRQVAAYLFDTESVKKVFEKLSPRFETRNGGYTRIVKIGERFGDGAYLCNLELVDFREHEGKARKLVSDQFKEKKAKAAENAKAAGQQ
jgi:large subunit ribosomal protein L17